MTVYDVYEVDKYKNEFFDQSFKFEQTATEYAKSKEKATGVTYTVKERQK